MARDSGYKTGGSQDEAPFQRAAHDPVPTRQLNIKDRSASPDRYATSGMERAMGALADKTHKC